MSDQEKKSSNATVVMVDQSATNRNKLPFRPTDMQENAAELHHKRSKAPAVPSVTEELAENVNVENTAKKESEHAMSSEKKKHSADKKLLPSMKRRGSYPETSKLDAEAIDAKKSGVTATTQPIPPHASLTSSTDLTAIKSAERKEEDDSITGDIPELRGSEVAKITSEWSDDEEAGGLPRSESRASRVSRAVRQLFCCGVQLETPSELRVSPRTTDDII